MDNERMMLEKSASVSKMKYEFNSHPFPDPNADKGTVFALALACVCFGLCFFALGGVGVVLGTILVIIGIPGCFLLKVKAKKYAIKEKEIQQRKTLESIRLRKSERKSFIDDEIQKYCLKSCRLIRDAYEEFLVAVDADNKKWYLIDAIKKESFSFKFSDLISFEVKQDGDRIASGNVGNALLGDILFGTVGDVVGASLPTATHTNCKELSMDIFVNDLFDSRHTLVFISHPMGKKSKEYKYEALLCKDVYSAFEYIKINGKIENGVKTGKQNINDYSDLIKLFELKEKGCLTQDEFGGRLFVENIEKMENNRALIECPDCGKQVSSRAKACPNCGRPIDVKIRCPKCGSSNTSVISGASKAASIAFWGPFAMNKVVSTYVCRNCKHKF